MGASQRRLLALVRDITAHKQLQAALPAAHDEPEPRVTERTAALKAALDENSRLSAAIDSTASGVIICDPNQPDTPIVFTNPAFWAIPGSRHRPGDGGENARRAGRAAALPRRAAQPPQ